MAELDDIVDLENSDGLGETVLRYASQIIPVADARPSSCINYCTFSPHQMEVTFHFKTNDPSASYPCGVSEWAEYKINVFASAGEFFNSFKSQHSAAPTAPTKPAPKGIAKNPYPKRF